MEVGVVVLLFAGLSYGLYIRLSSLPFDHSEFTLCTSQKISQAFQC
jgi:hypothetical protein